MRLLFVLEIAWDYQYLQYNTFHSYHIHTNTTIHTHKHTYIHTHAYTHIHTHIHAHRYSVFRVVCDMWKKVPPEAKGGFGKENSQADNLRVLNEMYVCVCVLVLSV